MGSKWRRFLPLVKQADYRWLIAAILLAYYFIYWGSLQNFAAQLDHCPKLFCDFTGFFIPAGNAVLNHTSLPDGFYYPVFAAMLFSLFVWLRPEIIVIVWGGIQLVSMVVFYLVLNKAITHTQGEKYIFLFLFLTGSSLLNNFKWGQISLLIAFGSFAALLFYRDGKILSSAILLGIMIALKYYPAVILIYFILKRDWKYIALCVVVIVVCDLLLPVVALGFSDYLRFQQASSAGIPVLIQLGIPNLDSQYISSVFVHLFLNSEPGLSFILPFSIAGILLTLSVVWLLSRIIQLEMPDETIWAGALLFSTLAFWLPNAWPHYFVYLPVLQILAFQKIKTWQGQKLWLPLFLLWIFSILLSSILLANTIHSWLNYAVLGCIFWSNVMALVAIFISFLSGVQKGFDGPLVAA